MNKEEFKREFLKNSLVISKYGEYLALGKYMDFLYQDYLKIIQNSENTGNEYIDRFVVNLDRRFTVLKKLYQEREDLLFDKCLKQFFKDRFKSIDKKIDLFRANEFYNSFASNLQDRDGQKIEAVMSNLFDDEDKRVRLQDCFAALLGFNIESLFDENRKSSDIDKQASNKKVKVSEQDPLDSLIQKLKELGRFSINKEIDKECEYTVYYEDQPDKRISIKDVKETQMIVITDSQQNITDFSMKDKNLEKKIFETLIKIT